MKTLLVFAFIFSLGSLAGSGWVYWLLISEQSERQALSAAQAEIDQITQTLNEDFTQFRAAVDGIREQLSQAVVTDQRVEKEIEASQAEIARITSQINKLETPSQVAPSESSFPGEGVESFTAPVTESEAAAEIVPKVPAVLTVNRKFNFVVVNLGSQDGAKIGDRLTVLRGDQTVGQVEIEKLYEKFSAAAILEEKSKFQIQEGDQLRSS